MPNRKPEFLNVQVSVRKEPTGQFVFTYEPRQLQVKRKDCVINYQLVDSPGIKLTGLQVSPQENDQFSVPSLSKSGKLITLSDANTRRQTFQITLSAADAVSNGAETILLPEVINQPETSGNDGDDEE